jgi:hypothetical protein
VLQTLFPVLVDLLFNFSLFVVVVVVVFGALVLRVEVRCSELLRVLAHVHHTRLHHDWVPVREQTVLFCLTADVVITSRVLVD